MNVHDLCRLLSATLHLPDVDRWAEHLEARELLPSFDHEVYTLDAALLLAAVVTAPNPAAFGRCGRKHPGAIRRLEGAAVKYVPQENSPEVRAMKVRKDEQ